MSDPKQGILASFDYLDSAVEAIEALRKAGFKRKSIQAFAPVPEHDLEHALGYGQSPVRVFALVGALTGTATGFALSIFTSMSWPLVVGGKPIVSIPAFIIIAFELTILFGALSTVIGLFINTRLPRLKPLVVYDPEFSAGRFGVYVSASSDRVGEARKILADREPAELREDPEGVGHA
ncbi:MAG: DUF3341 domain-containing protein [Gemmatimonadales bacterium]|nr:DUF3341 domain-containing protein [Longimicrobiales bacterium]TFH55459.1 MAG: DUF3341 domain-containing protein [Gemmatimonadales bacterium]